MLLQVVYERSVTDQNMYTRLILTSPNSSDCFLITFRLPKTCTPDYLRLPKSCTTNYLSEDPSVDYFQIAQRA